MSFDVLTINTAADIFGILICLIVILCRRFTVAVRHWKIQTDFTLLVLCEALILFFGASSGLLTGQDTQLSDTFLPICCFMKNLLTYLLLGFFTNYVLHSFSADSETAVHIFVWVIVLLSSVALALNSAVPFYYYIDGNNVCRRGELYSLSQLPCIAIYIENLIYIIVHRKRVPGQVLASFMVYMILPIGALVAQMLLYGLEFVNIALIAVIMLMFVVMQNGFTDEYIEQKRQLQESSFKLMVSQIKPHFIFNSLTAIAQLCDEDPALAKATTVSFAKYLRGNLTAMDKTEAIPFEEELNHIRNYLNVECVRFGEYLNIVYNIKTVDFCVPVLSIQPLVENAVKHGVGMKENGGTVKLSAYENGNCIEVIIADDGVGFDVSALPVGENHIGIANSVKRLKELCNAETVIKSTIGEGTEITVLIPKNKNRR